jgi:hypothetical protein
VKTGTAERASKLGLHFARPKKLHLFLAILLVGTACLSPLGLRSHATGPSKASARLLVKIRAPLAKTFETALPLQTMELVAGQSGNAQIDQFLTHYSTHKAHPLYASIVRLKKQRGLTDLQVATNIRQRFPRRASRLHASFQPPEISRTYVFELDPAAAGSLNDLLHALHADSNVEYVEEDKVVSTNFIPNDPYYSSSGSWGQPYDDLWGIKKIGSAAAWDTSTGTGIVVAVVDTGIDFTHPDITANIWTNPNPGGNGYIDDVHGWDFIGSTYLNPVQSNNPVDHFGHGTHVSGTIAACGNNGIGVIGVAWNAQIMPVKGLDDSGQGLDSTLGPAIIYAGSNGADVISNSWSGVGASQTIADAVSYAYNLGAVTVAAAGNDSADAEGYYPANLSNVITVAATDPNDVIAYFSNFGSKIDVAAPGVDILSLLATGTNFGTPVGTGYTRASGTSMAAPHVSGLAALILAQNPNYSNEDVRQVLRVSAIALGTSGFNLTYGYGRINAAAAMGVPSVLEAKIIAPADGTSLTGPATISGYARGNNFAQYTLAYGAGTTPSTWMVFATGTTPMGGTALGVFDPTLLDNGLYTIQLTSYDTSNNAFVDQIEVLNNVISISSPAPSIVPSTAVVFKPGAVIPVAGTAQGASLQDFRLDWAEGINPSSGWSTTGVTITGGTSPVLNGALGSWDTSSITQTDFYTIRLTVDNVGFTNAVTTLVYLDTSLLAPGWPQSLNQAPYFSIGLVPAADANGNVRLTTVTPTYNSGPTSQFWSFPAIGGSPNTVPLSYGEYLQPAVGLFNGTSAAQIIVADGLNVDVFQPDDSFSTESSGSSVDFQFSQITLQNINNNSQLQAVALGDEFANNTAYLYAWQNNGTQLNSNFPIAIPDQNISLTEARTGPRVLVGDLNGTGNREIIVQAGPSSSTTSLLLFAHDGTPLSWSAPTFNGYANDMALADLDHNGQLETLVLAFDGTNETLHVLQPDGTERAGWPQVLGTGYPFSYFAVGDITRTGNEQIVVANFDSLYVFNTNGTSLSSAWPLRLPGVLFGPPVLADVDGDNKPEIVLTEGQNLTFSGPLNPGSSNIAQSAAASSQSAPPNDAVAGIASLPLAKAQATTQSSAQSGSNYYWQEQVVALHPDGSTVGSWNLFGANGLAPAGFSVVTVGDFEHSGTTDIAVLSALAPGGSGSEMAGEATAFSTGAPYHPGANDWPMIFQNPQNAATRQIATTPPSVSITYPTSGATVAGQITVTASATDNVGIASAQFQLDGANLGAAVTAAPFAVVWDTTQTSLGSHTLTAIATDTVGNMATSTPVTVTVSQLATLGLSPSSLAFGGQPLNTTSSAQTVTVTNTGGISTTISSVSVTGDFAQTDNCGTLAGGGTCTVSVTYTPTVRGAETGNLTVNGNFSGASPTVTLSGSGQALLSTLSPTSLTFPGQTVGSTSAAQTFTYSNTGDLPVTISAISVTGDFAESSTCGATLSVGANCSVSVTFTPTARGTRSGTLFIVGNVNATAALSGQGQAVGISITPTSINFGNQTAGSTSAAQYVTITNTGDFSFYISGWSYGSPFTATDNCPFPINPGTNCTFGVTFAPTSVGSYQGTLTISGSFPGSPATITLSGTGQDTAAVLTSTSLSFGNQLVNTTSGSQSTTLVNTANTTVSISTIQATGDFSQTNNCGASLAVGTSCTINVTFHPTVAGARSGSLTVNSNTRIPIAPASLSGTGIAPAPGLSPASLSYAAQRVKTTSSAQSVTLSNTGAASLSISSFTVTGDFSQTNNCGTTLAAGGSCTVKITFTPTATGSRTGTLTLNSNAPGTAASVSLSGTGVASIAGLTPASLVFANQVVGTTSGAQAATLTNSGTATLNISSITVSGDFGQSNNCGTALATNASCTINVTFTPTASGTRSGTLTVADDSLNGSPQTVGLSGTATAAATTTTVASNLNPSTFGQSVTFTAAVQVSSGSGPTGTVTFLDGATSLGTVNLANSSAQFATSSLVTGSHSITVKYSGDANFTGSTSGALTQVVNPATSSGLAIDAQVSVDQATAKSTVSTGSFSTTAGNELLLAFIATDYISGSNTTVTNVTGGGLTWALVLRSNKQKGTSEIWRAFAVSPLSNAQVTATLSHSVVSSMTAVSFTGANTSGSNGSGAIGATVSTNAGSGAPTATLVTTRNNSWVFGVGNDYDNAISRTLGSGQVLIHQYLSTTGDTYWVQRRNAPTLLSGTSVTINDTAPTSDRYNLAICEILPAQ